MGAPEKICQLIETFDRNIETYKNQGYNETQIRREFIDPFFEELGWDVTNKSGYAQAYKDVIHEDAIKVGSATKAPDYSFRIGGARKFFVEAKKPSVDIKDDAHPAYQLRRYAWSAKLPLSILTDFEGFAVYDCLTKPSHTDRASTGRVMYFTYKEYAEHWDEIAETFSKEAVLKGSFDKYAITTKGKRGTGTVDIAFLEEINNWRKMLAQTIAYNNRSLSKDEVNFSVQRTIDRILFLRMCEDRGIEPYKQLHSLANGSRVYPRLCELFERADIKYNSGLFHFRPEKDRAESPDELTLNLTVDDGTLRLLFGSLYYPKSPYEFSVLPAEILGNVYEQFLGMIITVSPARRVSIDLKPAVKKAGGVYYTPSYIVDYIVKNTVGKLCESKTPKQISKLKILDPACGSGSFLLGAYTCLLNYHRDWYVENDPAKYTKQIYQGKGGLWLLTIAEKKKILLNNIYGVDIDSQAVEVTKLSLLLKVLESECLETIGQIHERALPDLGNNIKCGNSLIGPDFFDDSSVIAIAARQSSSFDSDDLHRRINPFDWQKEFPQVFNQSRDRLPGEASTKSGKGAETSSGFDAVIGNPPYIRMETFTASKDYLRTRYSSHEERADLYAYFLEKGLSLLNPTGTLGFIVSNKFIKAKYGHPLRKLLYSDATIKSIADFAGANVFKGATVRTVVICMSRKVTGIPVTPTIYVPVPDAASLDAIDSGHLSIMDYVTSHAYQLPENALNPSEWRLVGQSHSMLIDKLRKANLTLSEFTDVHAVFGVKSGLNEAFIVDKATRAELIRKHPSAKTVLRPILFGKDVRRFHTNFAQRYIIYLHPDKQIQNHPSIRAYLEPFKSRLENRAGPQQWYELQQPATVLLKLAKQSKIVYPIIANECRFTIDSEGFLINDKAFLLPLKDPVIVGILNSSLGYFYFSNVCAALEGGKDRYLEFRAQYVDRFPMPSKERVKASRNKMVLLVERMLELHKKLNAAKVPDEKTKLQRQIDTTDSQIDKLVYELYGLTADEIKIVESGK